MFRLFQNNGISIAYRKRFDEIARGTADFKGRLDLFLHDRYNASHILKPMYEGDPSAFLTNGDDDVLQKAWAKQKGLKWRNLADILLAQIEEHKTEVFYNTDPFRFDGKFLHRLPGHVKWKIAWRAAPGNIDFSGYDLIVSNFASIRSGYEKSGFKTAHLSPSHDPALDEYAKNTNRDIDILFFGGFSRHHMRRASFLTEIAGLSSTFNIAMHLSLSKMTHLAETPLGMFGYLSNFRRPVAIRRITAKPIFGREMYQQLSRAKIVINMAIDMAGRDRGNMRCFEAMGSAAMLLSDEGNYPQGMEENKTLITYHSNPDAMEKIPYWLQDARWSEIAANGHRMIRTLYSKEEQWKAFNNML